MVRVYRTTDLSVERIADLYGVCRRTVYNVLARHADELHARKGPPSDTGEPNRPSTDRIGAANEAYPERPTTEHRSSQT